MRMVGGGVAASFAACAPKSGPLPPFGGVACWWLRAFVGYSLWGLAYGGILALLGNPSRVRDPLGRVQGPAAAILAGIALAVLLALAALGTLARRPSSRLIACRVRGARARAWYTPTARSVGAVAKGFCRWPGKG